MIGDNRIYWGVDKIDVTPALLHAAEPSVPPVIAARRPELGPFHGIVIEPNDLGDGWMATFYGFNARQAPIEPQRGSTAFVGDVVNDVMQQLLRRRWA